MAIEETGCTAVIISSMKVDRQLFSGARRIKAWLLELADTLRMQCAFLGEPGEALLFTVGPRGTSRLSSKSSGRVPPLRCLQDGRWVSQKAEFHIVLSTCG
jgi:hypothetical protein